MHRKFNFVFAHENLKNKHKKWNTLAKYAGMFSTALTAQKQKGARFI
jgi:hypothetical protein